MEFKTDPMKRFLKLLLVVASLLVVHGTTTYVLMRNQLADVYPSDGDSIGIPFYGELFQSVIFAALFAVAIFLPVRYRVTSIISVMIFAWVAIASATTCLYWAIPDHYEIACANALVAVLSCCLAVLPGRRAISRANKTLDWK